MSKQIETKDSSGNRRVIIRNKRFDKYSMEFEGIENVTNKIRSHIDLRLLINLKLIAVYNTGAIILDSAERKRLSQELEISNTALSTAIRRLKDVGLIINFKEGIYLNPHYIWIGNNSSRLTFIKDIEDEIIQY